MKALGLIALLCFALPIRADYTRVTEKVFLDAARFAVVDKATKVEACILHLEPSSNGQKLNEGTVIEGPYKTLPEEIKTLITWKLLDDQSYAWNLRPACLPIYNARVRFTEGDRTVTIDFCFSCKLTRVLEQGKQIGGGNFSFGNDWVFRAIATQFADNPVIVDLETRRRKREANELAIEMAKAREARSKSIYIVK
jgi:hypothetical protein